VVPTPKTPASGVAGEPLRNAVKAFRQTLSVGAHSHNAKEDFQPLARQLTPSA